MIIIIIIIQNNQSINNKFQTRRGAETSGDIYYRIVREGRIGKKKIGHRR